jgi:hypothetical protein
MAALNIFRTVTLVITTTTQTVYTAPDGYTGIVLMAQISNVGATTAKATVSLFRNGVATELVNGFSIPANDASSVTTGKLVLETGNSLQIVSDTNNALKLTLSILESANG